MGDVSRTRYLEEQCPVMKGSRKGVCLREPSTALTVLCVVVPSIGCSELRGGKPESDMIDGIGQSDVDANTDTAASSEEALTDSQTCECDTASDEVLTEGNLSDSESASPDSLDQEAAEADAYICGITEAGYQGSCDLILPGTGRSTLCDETSGRCFAAKENCGDGWCVIPGASFQAGQSIDGLRLPYSASAGILNVPRSFEIAETETTLSEFELRMGYVPANSPGECGGSCPVGGASIFEAMEYANQMSGKFSFEECYVLNGCRSEISSSPKGDYPTWMCDEALFKGPECTGYRLPSAAEWELAARAGSPTCLWGGAIASYECATDEPDARASYCANSEVAYGRCYSDLWSGCGGPQPVRGTLRNPFGLYEVAGGVMEWAQSECPASDSLVPLAGPPFPLITKPEFVYTVTPDTTPCALGGSWHNSIDLTCAHDSYGLDIRGDNTIAFQIIGFRLARTLR